MVQVGDIFKDGSAVFKVKKFGADGALVGSVTWYAGAGTPENYLLCDGSAVSRTDYVDLFAVIGTAYGAGDGSTTFNLPLLTDNRFIEGSNIPGTQHEAGLPNITGDIVGATWATCFSPVNSGAFTPSGPLVNAQAGNAYNQAYNRLTFSASKCSKLYKDINTVQPLALTLRPIIKYI